MKRRNRDKDIVHRVVALPDTHVPLEDRAAVACSLEAIRQCQPDTVVHLGDIGDWESVCHFKWRRIKRPPINYITKDIRRDIKAVVTRLIDPLDSVCDEAGVTRKIITQGNHDRWLDNFIEENPDYLHTKHNYGSGYDFKSMLNWTKRGWEIYETGRLLQIKKLRFYHGHVKGGVYHARQHLLAFGVSIVYGHWHDVQQMSVMHSDGAKSAWSIGCLKKLDAKNNEWLEGGLHNWGHAFAVIDFWGCEGKYTVNVVRIINGKCSFFGHLLDGNKLRKRLL